MSENSLAGYRLIVVIDHKEGPLAIFHSQHLFCFVVEGSVQPGQEKIYDTRHFCA